MQVTFNLTSRKGREDSLSLTIHSLLRQTVKNARINLYLNYPVAYNYYCGIDVIPFVGDLGDTGKFYEIAPGWNLFVDDDLIYPPNYAETLITQSCMKRCPVGVHGAILRSPVRNYFKDRSVIHFSSPHEGSFVNVIGTGTLCFHSDLGFTRDDIEQPNMSDCYFAAWCQERKIPLYCIKRDSNFLTEVRDEDSLWSSRGDGKKQTTVVNRVKNWGVFSN